MYTGIYFPSRSHTVYPDALVLGLGLHGANETLAVRGIYPQFGWGGHICWQLLIS